MVCFMLLKEVSYAHQDGIYLIRNTIQIEILQFCHIIIIHFELLNIFVDTILHFLSFLRIKKMSLVSFLMHSCKI